MAVLAGLVGVAVRWRQAQQLERRVEGTGPAVLTDDGVRLHVDVDGRGDAPVTVVFAHGFAATTAEFDAQRRGLRDRARLVLFDQRGHGRSGWGSFRAATLDRLARDLGHVVDECGGAGPVVLVGHSLGSMAVLALADARPSLFGDKVRGVVLVSASAGGTVPGLSGRQARMLAGTPLLRVLGWALWFVAPLTARLHVFGTGLGRRVLRHYLFGTEPPADRTLSEVQAMWVATAREVAGAFYPRMLSHDTTDALQVLATVPCLVLTGVDDRTIAPGHSDRIATTIGPTARLIRVPGAGHMVNMTHWESVNGALRELVDQISGSGTEMAGVLEAGTVPSRSPGLV